MLTRSLPFRIFALVAAYALALQALLLNMTPAAAFAGSAASLVIICKAAPQADQPAGQDYPPCAHDCLMAACGHGGLAPADSTVAEIIAPVEFRVLVFVSDEIRGRAIAKTPQIPRAPPLA